jgi:arylsulfatase A-like enzyme
MMARQARYVVQKAPGIDGPPIPDDEPVLVIRAQDVLAARMMRLYIDFYTLLDDHGDDVVDEMNEHLDALIEWQLDHPVKTADR